MSNLALVQDGQTDPTAQADSVRAKIRAAREYRKPYEPTWLSNLAFAAGQHWTGYDLNTRTIRHLADIDPERYGNRELYQADIISEYRLHTLGELASDDDRPELLLQRDDSASEDFQKVLNRAVGFGWDFEARADEALAESDRLCVDLGTSAIRVRFDNQVGPVTADDVPHENGLPLLEKERAVRAVAKAAEQGRQLEHKPIHEGRITLEPLSAFNLLTPAGVNHERYFPWECVVRPVALEKIRAEFGQVAEDLLEDGDIGSSLGLVAESSEQGQAYALGTARASRLRDHAWLFTFYEHASSSHPCGRTWHFAGNDMALLKVDERLPYVGPDKSYRSGISYFHWVRVTGRFYSRGLVENLKDGQRAKNEHRTTTREIIRKGRPYVLMPKAYVEGEARRKTDEVAEIVPYDPAIGSPTPVAGFGPGAWMSEEDAQIEKDVTHAAGINPSALGENPSGVETYGQLALLREADATKRKTQIKERSASIRQIVEDMVHDMKAYWGEAKMVMLAGDDDRVDTETFNATKIPSFFIVKVARGAAKPRSQAAELKKVEDIWRAANESGVVTTNPALWIAWYKESLDAGQVQELPESPADDHSEKAEFENHVLLDGSVEEMQVQSYDPAEIHVPVHTRALIQAELSGDLDAWERLTAHVGLHEAQQAEAAQAEADAQAAQVEEQQAEELEAQAQADAAAQQEREQDFTHKAQLEVLKAAAQPSPSGGQR